MAIADHEMVDDAHANQSQRLGQAAGKIAVGKAWFGVAGRMVVHENGRCGIMQKRALDHLTRIHDRCVYRSLEQDLLHEQAVTDIEKKAGKGLARTVAKGGGQVAARYKR